MSMYGSSSGVQGFSDLASWPSRPIDLRFALGRFLFVSRFKPRLLSALLDIAQMQLHSQAQQKRAVASAKAIEALASELSPL